MQKSIVRCLYLFYPDISPETLIERSRESIHIKHSEMERARWFWKRRPIPLLLSSERILWIVIFYLLTLVVWLSGCAHIHLHEFISAVAFSLLALFFAVLSEAYTYARWKRDYCCAISRLLAEEAS